MGRIFTLLVALLLFQAQTITITGTVSDSLSSAPFSVMVSRSMTMGETTVLGATNGGDGGLISAYKVALPQQATIDSLSFYVIAAAGQLRLGVYDAAGPSGGPGRLLAQIPEITPVVGWNTTKVVAPALLSAGAYWLAYHPSDDRLTFPLGSMGAAEFTNIGYGALPDPYPQTNLASGGYSFSLYATLLPVPQGGFTINTSVNPPGAGTITITPGP